MWPSQDIKGPWYWYVISGDVKLDHLAKVMLASYLHYKVTAFLLVISKWVRYFEALWISYFFLSFCPLILSFLIASNLWFLEFLFSDCKYHSIFVFMDTNIISQKLSGFCFLVCFLFFYIISSPDFFFCLFWSLSFMFRLSKIKPVDSPSALKAFLEALL